MRGRGLQGLFPELLLELLLGCAVVLAAVDLATHFRTSRLEVGRVRLGRLDDATRERLDDLDDRVFVTYYSTPVDRMPSHLRQLEREVTDLLQALKDASDGQLDYQVVDPSSDPSLEAYAARRKVSPVRVRHVTRDAYSEQEIWSTLSIAHGPRAPALIEGLGNEHLPRLQSLIVEQLNGMQSPRQPVFALAAPDGFEAFEGWLAERGPVLRVAHDGSEALPMEADILYWMDPAPLPPARLDELDGLLDAGRAVVIAAGRQRGELSLAEGLPSLMLQDTGYDGDALWGRFGLVPMPLPVFDGRCQALGEDRVFAPFRVMSIANNQDFHDLAFEPNGNLIFELPTPLALDADAMNELGWSAEVLATSSDLSWTQETDGDQVPLVLLREEAGSKLPKQPLLTWLRRSDPWKGSIVACASSSPFRDDLFQAEGVAHQRLAKVLVDTLAAPDRLVLTHAEIRRPEPLPALPSGARAGWRLFCVLLVPGLLLLRAFFRGRVGGARASGKLTGGWPLAVTGRGVAGLVVVSAAAAFLAGRLDLTDGGLNQLHPHTRTLAAAAIGEQAVRAEVVFSDRDRLPPELRVPSDRLLELLRELRSAGADLDLERLRPDEMDEGERARLESQGVRPIQMASRRDEVTEVRSVWCSLRLSAGGRHEIVDFPDAAAYEDLEFRVAFALSRLATGRRPHIAFAADTPRLSAAESHRYYQTQGLISPQGTDEYSLARARLEEAGFRLSHVDPGDPVVPDDIDLLVWLQPRRPTERLFPEVVDYLYRGGSVLMAVQHFDVQPQQFRGANFEFAYWPRPQTPDVDAYYLPELGLHLVREVLFDELSLPVELESQVNVTEKRDFRDMRTALPFLIRAVGTYFDTGHPITRALGDQAFLSASFLDIDEDRLSELGLRERTLMTTSPRAWTYLWTGGWLAHELFDGPLPDEAGEVPGRQGPLALATLVEGQFPWPEKAFERPSSFGGSEEPGVPDFGREEPVSEAAEGRLLVVACSEVFQDEHLTKLAPEFRGDHLLLNAAAFLALDEGLADVMARRPVARGFDRLPEDERLRWRLGVVFGAPLLYLLVALLRGFAGRRFA